MFYLKPIEFEPLILVGFILKPLLTLFELVKVHEPFTGFACIWNEKEKLLTFCFSPFIIIQFGF